MLQASCLTNEQATVCRKRKAGGTARGWGLLPPALEQWPKNGERLLFIHPGPSRCFENETHPFAVLFPAIPNHLFRTVRETRSRSDRGSTSGHGKKIHRPLGELSRLSSDFTAGRRPGNKIALGNV